MLLRELELENYGLFIGKHSLTLAPDPSMPDRPVVLIGGENGAGKTTILDAIRLCLYGRLALGIRVTNPQYLEHLRSKIHRPADGSEGPRSARITLQFDYAVEGKRHLYEVTRRWRVTRHQGEPIKESLTLLRDGERLDTVGEEHWDHVVEDLVPYGVSQLFFFDGEKIMSLAEDGEGMEHLAEAMKSMLGLDLVERLRADLALYRSRKLKEQAKGGLASELEHAEANLKEVRIRLGQVREEKHANEMRLNTVQANHQLAETELRRKGGEFAASREASAKKQAAVEQYIANLEAEGRRLTEGVLPFSYCPSLANRLLNQLDLERQRREYDVLESHLLEFQKRVVDAILQHSKLSPSLRAEFHELGRETRHKYLNDKNVKVDQVHGIAENTARMFETWIESANEQARKRGLELAEVLRDMEGVTRDLQRRLVQAPAEDALADVVAQVAAVGAELKLAGREVERAREEEKDAERALAHFERVRERVEQKLEQMNTQDKRLEIAAKAIQAMEDYQQRLTVARTESFSNAMARRFHQLARKDDLVADVHVDTDTFDVTLIGPGGREIARSELSAGEKQIYAVATLWGLADTSMRPLPMVIDTPLGRLDGAHRSNLIHHYFPKVSHQVIILSTDTEVDERLFEELEPYVNRAYRLETNDGRSKIQRGYFWKSEVVG